MSEILAKDNNVRLKKHTQDMLDAFSKIENHISNESIQKAIKWSIILHDIGKVLPYFQIRILKNNKYQPWDVNKDLNIYHSLASVLFINQAKLKEKVGENSFPYSLSAIAYHHWKTSLEEDLRFGSDKFEKLFLMDTKFKNDLINNLKDELSGVLEDADKEIISLNTHLLKGLSQGISFADYVIAPYQMYWLPKRLETETGEKEKKEWILISGWLQRCDHYASFCEETEAEQIENIEIIHEKSLDIAQNIKEQIKNKKHNVDKLWQEEILNENNYKENLILIAPTGCGKTEFAFLWAGKDKFFYTLPLRAAVEQIYDRAKSIFGDDKTGLLHSDADVYLLGDDYHYEKIKTYEVAKHLSYPVIVSTGDQFFPYGMRPPGYERIYATFAYSRLVIDEVQAYDPRAAAIIVKFIEDITRMGGKFLLMTATLPEYVKKEIEERIGSVKELNIYETEKEKYQKLIKHKLQFNNIDNSQNQKDKNKTDFVLGKDIIDKIIDKSKDKRVLVIVNTVKQAKDIYENLKNKTDGKQIFLFHSQMTFNEKQKIKETIEKEFKNPKDQNDNQGKVLIATQVIEAAIDIDADILFTEICPMDALVQRMGRVLRRHKEDYSLDNQSEPNVYVLVFKNDYESGNGRVYDKELIEKTLILFDNYQEENVKNINIEKYYKKDRFLMESLKIFNNYYRLPEYQKYDLVKKLYEIPSLEDSYLKEFYSTLDILDAGFMSDRKEEAQRMFREIFNIQTIDETKKENFKKKIKELKENLNYTRFKKDIIAEFVISLPYFTANKAQKGNVSKWIDEDELGLEKKEKERIKKWCGNILIVNFTDKTKENII